MMDNRSRTGVLKPAVPWRPILRLKFDDGKSISVTGTGDYLWLLGSLSGNSHPVGSKLPNDLRVFDVHGNAWEWSLDARTLDGTSFELLEVNSSKRALFGGAFNSVLRNVELDSNTSARPDNRSNYYGFRVARGLP